MNAVVGEALEVVSIDRPILTPGQEQDKWLGEAVQAVKEKAARMKTYIRQREFIHVLRNASQMLLELRTGMLAPQHYYELYIKVFDELQHLEQYIEEEHSRGRSLGEMYEVVQHAGNIVPRLYLLITVGSVYVKSGEEPAIEIMRDLVEMCKGVQHPTRGLFLRHFLLTMMKNKLPGDSGRGSANSLENDGGTVEDTAELILQNFSEMNWLLIRIEAKAPPRAVEVQSQLHRRQRDRKELCVLVGMNVVRLSQLEGVERQAYKNTILPRLLNIIVKYREPLAQQYLLDVIVQVFPDEFHLFTLNELLAALEDVSSGVDVCATLASLMERLGNYATSLREGLAEVSGRKEERLLQTMFDVFKARLDAMLAASEARNGSSSGKLTSSGSSDKNSGGGGGGHPKHPFTLAAYLRAMMSLVRLTLRADRAAAVEHIGAVFTAVAGQLTLPLKEPLARAIERMIVHVIETLKDPSVVLGILDLEVLTQKLPFFSRRVVAVTLCSASVQSTAHRIGTLELSARLFELLAPLLQEEPDAPAQRGAVYVGNAAEEFREEQNLVCRVLHLLRSDDDATQLKMLNGVRKLLGQCGPERIAVTLPTLVSLYVRLALRTASMAEAEGNDEGGAATKRRVPCTRPFQIIHCGDGKGILEMLAAEQPVEGFQLYLTSANAADTCGLPDVAYELYVSAFQLYEENAADTREQIEMLTCLISSLYGLRSVAEENYELLATKVCQYSSKLVRKVDRSRVVALCASLFWKTALSEESHRRVLECLQRALKIADHVQEAQRLALFVELLNRLLHYYATSAPGVTVQYISALIDLVQEATNSCGGAGAGDTDDDGCEADALKDAVGEKNASHGTDVGSAREVYTAARTFYRNTTRYIRSRQQVDERWKEIDV
ncbi:vacuolar sorting-associated-like protein [Trypanosoma conorhini]|uniref:Vacuolar protein sorting-associated protein 35 n=1 Tax=Trypanosoma conorhini TaxID=83891 RepID=A0A422PTK1_9TRYP|nr:vacuolar sorting-associated-like protein [Trypanosoma conorhini]RNF21085.1 vacuolar sorting-associated-like protein [Trypanosoma conorhini]